MEPAQAKPLKRRRRRLIVAFFLMLVSLVTWWYWPRGDARFVGTWALSPDPAGNLDVVPGQTLTFFRHGVSRAESGGSGVHQAWRVEGNQLVTGTVNFNGLSSFTAKQWILRIQQFLEGSMLLLEGRYEIISIQRDIIVLRPENLKSNLILTRVPE